MTVVRGLFGGEKYTEEEFSQLDGTNVPSHFKEFIATHCCINRVAYLMHKDADGNVLHRPNIIGNKTEGSLIIMANSWGLNDDAVKAETFKEGRDKIFAFNSAKKRSTAIIQLNNGRIRLYCKGATEWVLKDCTTYLDTNGKSTKLYATKRQEFESFVKEMAESALRTLCLAHRDFPSMSALPVNWRESPPDFEELTMDCIVGIIDPLRSDVKDAVTTAQKAGVTVRMVTGDNIETAKAIARQCGILTEGGMAIEGPMFRELTPAQADEILPSLQVMARSSPDDKYLLVTRLNGHGIPEDQEKWEVKRVTNKYLSSGDERAITCNEGKISSACAGVNSLNIGPSIAIPPSVRIPHCLAIALAVSILSPVTILTVTPAFWAVVTASLTSLLNGSIIPTIQSIVNSSKSGGDSLQFTGKADMDGKSR
jgi:hypothetical protein